MESKKIAGLVLAGGLGLRLDPLSTPKPLVRVGTKPMILWTINYLQQLGIEDIWLAVGQNGDAIQKELIGNKAITSRIHYLRMPNEPKSMFQTLAFAVANVPGSLLVTPCDLIFDKYPVKQEDLASLRANEAQVLAAPLTKSPHFGPQLLLEVENPGSSKPTVRDVGLDLERGNFHDVGIYLLGEEAKSRFAVPLEKAANGAAFHPFLKELFAQGKAQLKIAELGDWCDVNTAVDRIRAEFLVKQKKAAPAKSQSTVSASVPRAERHVHSFELSKPKTTQVIVEPGILQRLEETDLIPPATILSNHYLVTDSLLHKIVGGKIEESFRARGFNLRSIVVPGDEQIKTIEEYWKLMLEILALGVDKNSIIINLGGGAIANVAGFVASTLFRGITLYHLPTTLLAQLDSSVDIKHAINTPYGKNLVGSFYAADKVIIDPLILKTLPRDHIVNGLSESIKHALVQDVGFLDFYEKYNGPIEDPVFLEKVINWTIDLKIQCMTGKPDGGLADGIKDYGHSLGHALEQYTGYEISHGQAIAVGMCLSAEISRLLELTSDREVDKHYEIFAKYGLATSVTPDVDFDAFEVVLKRDKTYMQGNAYMGLISELGRLWNNKGNYVIPVDMELVRRALKINQSRFSASQPIKTMTYVTKV